MHSFILITNNKQIALKKITEILKNKVRPWRLQNTTSADAGSDPAELQGQTLLEFLNNPDIIPIKPENSIVIAQIRKLKKLLSRKPISLPIQAGLIFQSELMTLPAQNAFLKLLEEPGKNTLLFLITKNAEALLPTIRSRCQEVHLTRNKLKINEKTAQKTLKFLKKLQKASPGQRLALIEPFEKSREEAIKFCQNTIYILQAQLLNKPCKDRPLSSRDGPCRLARTVPAEVLAKLKNTQQALNDLENNINVKLVLDNWTLDC